MHSIPILALAATAAAGSVSLNLQRSVAAAAPRGTSAQKREVIKLDALNDVVGYYINVDIGSPGQKMRLHLDTGSSDTWVNSAEDLDCQGSLTEDMKELCQYAFNPDNSTTYKLVERSGFQTSYVDGSTASGDWFNDTVTLDGHKIEGQQMGLATTSSASSGTGLLGLGFRSMSAADKLYPLVVENMVSSGLIERAAFSLYLNDDDSSAGTIMFGGIDTGKFSGQLKSVPLNTSLTATENQTWWMIDFPEVGGQKTTKPVALLDSGSTLSILEASLTSTIGKDFGVQMVTIPSIYDISVAVIHCKYARRQASGGSIPFTFGTDAVIQVAIEELAYDVGEAAIREAFGSFINVDKLPFGAKDTCIFGVQDPSFIGASSIEFALIGDTVLRSAYAVYDMDNKAIGLAQASFNSTVSNVVDLKANETLPTVTGTGPVTIATSSDGLRLAQGSAISLLALFGASILLL